MSASQPCLIDTDVAFPHLVKPSRVSTEAYKLRKLRLLQHKYEDIDIPEWNEVGGVPSSVGDVPSSPAVSCWLEADKDSGNHAYTHTHTHTHTHTYTHTYTHTHIHTYMYNTQTDKNTEYVYYVMPGLKNGVVHTYDAYTLIIMQLLSIYHTVIPLLLMIILTSCVLYTAVTESGTMLPKGWQRMEDEQKKPYYWHIPTGRTQYIKPTGENLERLVSGSYHVPQSASLYI